MAFEESLHLLHASWFREFVDVTDTFEGRLEASDSIEDQLQTNHRILAQLPFHYAFSQKQFGLFRTEDSESSTEKSIRKDDSVVVVEELVVENNEFAYILAEELDVMKGVFCAERSRFMELQ